MNNQDLPYRQCVGVALFNAENKVFVGERIDTPGAWQMPQGGIDEGEHPEETAFRELKEEIGTDNAKIILKAPEILRYDLPKEKISELWNGRYRGQEQIWYAMRFTGLETDINLQTFDPPEFSNWKWVKLEKTLDLIVPFKRELYQNIINMFKNEI